MRKIQKKVNSEYFEAILSGKKTYELRLADFDVQEGDVLILEEWDPESQHYTGRKIEKHVLGVDKFEIDKLFWPEEEVREKGLQIISFK